MCCPNDDRIIRRRNQQQPQQSSPIRSPFRSNDVLKSRRDSADRGVGATTATLVRMSILPLLGVIVRSAHYYCFDFWASHVHSHSLVYGGLILSVIWCAALRILRHRWGTVVVDCVHKVDDVMMRVSSSQTLTRIKSSVSSMRLMDFSLDSTTAMQECDEYKRPDCYRESKSPKIALPTPFLSLEAIAALSLTDVQTLVRYAVQVNTVGFDRKHFTATLNSRCLEAVLAMDAIVAASRGIRSTMSIAPVVVNDKSSSFAGDVDALVFVAFVRIFAEWRSLRLVPDGFQGYAVGMGLAKRDLIRNVLKVETAVHLWMDDMARTKSGSVSTPTLRQLLVWERDMNLHHHLPKLKEKSGASGLLWIQRQLKYQTAIFHNLTNIPFVYPTGRDAVAAAYEATYDKYHGFFVKQIFRRSFDAAPSANNILAHMGRATTTTTTAEAACTDNADVAELQRTNSLDSDDTVTEAMTSDSEDDSVPPPPPPPIDEAYSPAVHCMKHPLDQFADHIVSEWMKFERFMNQCHGGGSHPFDTPIPSSRNAFIGPSASVVNMANVPAMKQSSSVAMAVEEEIPVFISAMQPVLRGLDKLINQLNMNDPSKC